MSNYENESDKLRAHLEELIRKHKELDIYLEEQYSNLDVAPEVRILKTRKLWIKDEIHRIETKLAGEINGSV
jgi:hypothetical protein